MRRLTSLMVVCMMALAGAGPALADCSPAVANRLIPGVSLASLKRVAEVEAGDVKLTFVGHATFQIETPGGIVAVTDYNDYVRPRGVPDLITMNNAHDTHYTNHVDPRIAHVLKGWAEAGEDYAKHDVTVGDLRVHNVPTNVRDYNGTRYNGNSIFIFEASDLCIAHLGHLHHVLTPEHLEALGHVDVLLVPVDGGWTMDLEGMIEVIGQIHPSLIIPMHYFSPNGLQRFLTRLAGQYPSKLADSASLTLSRGTLPSKTEITVLPGR